MALVNPASFQDFQRAALQRLGAAEFLLRSGYNLEAKYLAGYVIECSLKAMILKVTPVKSRAATLKKISSGKKMHSAEVLGGHLKDQGHPIPIDIVRKLRRVSWSTDMRYYSGRPRSGETRGTLKVAKSVYDWVEGQLK